MLHSNRVMLRLITLVLLVALAVPAVAVSTPAAAQTSQPSAADSFPRVQARGWMDGVPAADQPAQLARIQSYLDAQSARVPAHPPVDPAQQAQTTAQWTVMVHVAGDNNLESAALLDVDEMESIGSSADVNIVVQIDRSTDYATWDGDWTGGRRYLIQQDNKDTAIRSTLLEDMGEIDSGDPQTVSDFVTWAVTNYPAQRYMLVLWDHGGGWTGSSSDEESDSSLTTPEMATALQTSLAATGVEKFDVVIFDMCLMGQLEVMDAIAPYARYAVGSEELVPGPGMNYTFLGEMVNNPAIATDAISKQVVDYFMYFYSEVMSGQQYYSLAAVDLSKVGAVQDALTTFTAAVQTNPEAALSLIADARNNTLTYAGWEEPRLFDYFSSVDLYMFLDLLAQLGPSPEIQSAAQGVNQAITDFVIENQFDPPLAGSHGVSIYFPRTPKAYTKYKLDQRYPTEIPQGMKPWQEFINLYLGTATNVVTEAPVVDVISVYPENETSIYQPAVVTMEVSGRDILQVNYAIERVINENERVVLDFDYLVSRTTTPTGANIVNWADGVTTRTFTWENEVPMITDGTTSTYALLIPNRDNPEIATVNGEYKSVDSPDAIQAYIVFDLNTRQGTALWGLNETESGSVQPFQIQPQAGDTFRPLWLTMDANNELVGQSFGDTLALGGEQPISFTKVPAPSGQYSISFVAENVAGQKTGDETLLTVNNENLDPALRGYTDLTYGVNFRYPANWIRPRFTPDGKRLFTADLETGTVLSLYPYTDVTTAEETANAVKNSWSDLANLQIGNQREVEINGLPAYVIDYTYDYENQPRVGAVIAIYVPDQNVGYGFDLDAPAAAPAPAQQALQVLVDSINFFTPAQAVGESGWQTVSPAGSNISFQVPANWTAEQSGTFTLYGPPDNKQVFAALGSIAASGQTKEQIAEFYVQQLQSNEQNVTIQASQPYYVGSQEWYLVVFTYEKNGEKIAGAFFATTAGGQDYVFWIEAPDAQFDQLYADTFSVTVNSFAFTNGEG